MTAFTTALLDTEPPIPGLDKTIVISARRMHLTLGVMSLVESESPQSPENGDHILPRTLEAAKGLLNGLKPRIMSILSGQSLKVALQRVDIMKPERGSLEKAHVFWAGPAEDGEDVVRLKAVCSAYHVIVSEINHSLTCLEILFTASSSKQD